MDRDIPAPVLNELILSPQYLSDSRAYVEITRDSHIGTDSMRYRDLNYGGTQSASLASVTSQV